MSHHPPGDPDSLLRTAVGSADLSGQFRFIGAGPSPAPACLRALLWREEELAFVKRVRPVPLSYSCLRDSCEAGWAGFARDCSGAGARGSGSVKAKDTLTLSLHPSPLGTEPLPEWIWTLPAPPSGSCPLLPAWPLPSCPLCWSFSPCYVIFGTLLINKGIKSQSKQVPDSLASGLGLTVSWSPVSQGRRHVGRTVL